MFGLVGGWTKLRIFQGQHLDKYLRLRYQNNPGFSEIVEEKSILICLFLSNKGFYLSVFPHMYCNKYLELQQQKKGFSAFIIY